MRSDDTAGAGRWEPGTPPELVLFDLDGTLSDSAAGITSSMRHALGVHGIPVPDAATLQSFVGPPFAVALSGIGLTEPVAEQVVRTYREHYGSGGLFVNELYPGIPELLERLTHFGIRLAVATSKPQATARRIVEHFGLAGWFEGGLEGVFGADTARPGDAKADVIGRALTRLGMTSQTERARAVMVGDREHDVIGATVQGLTCLGVSWGYAAEGELMDAGARLVVDSPAELASVLMRSGADDGP